MEICLKSLYIGLAIWVFLESILLCVGIYYSDGNRKTMILTITAFRIIMWISLPLLLLITSGVC